MAVITGEPSLKPKGTIRWTYIFLPLAVFLLSVILLAVFYLQLPEEVAYHFDGGTPDRWLSRIAIIAWTVLPQLVLVFIGLVVVFSAAMAVRHLPDSPLTRRLMLIIGNIVALPQIILTFAMLDIFLYNIHRIHLMPVWIFALAAMVLVGIALCIFFIQAVRQTRRSAGKSPQE